MIIDTVNCYAMAAAGGGGGGATVVEEFDYTGAAETTVVPSGYTSVTVWLWGGAGGNGNWNTGAWSGGGGFMCATFPCSPGDTLKFEVGGGGAGAARNANGGLGGWPDGGDGGKGDGGSGGGGGSTRFYIGTTLKAVAGGGGGSGGGTGSAGGGGGTTAQSASTGGTGGSQIAGGVDSNDTGNANKTGRSIVAFPGVARTGGFGSGNGDRTISSSDDGGGGGGGYWGGGGGGGDIQAGGGGSSWTDSDATSVTHYRAERQTPALAPLAYSLAANGVNSGSNGPAVAGGNGYAIAFFGTPYSIAGGTNTTASSSNLANYKTVIPITIGAATAKWLYARITGASATAHRAIIYADSGGNPGALVASTSALTSAGASTFLVFDLADLALPAGNYWVGLHSDAANSVGYAATGASVFQGSDAYSDGSTNPFGTPLAFTSGTYHYGIVYL